MSIALKFTLRLTARTRSIVDLSHACDKMFTGDGRGSSHEETHVIGPQPLNNVPGNVKEDMSIYILSLAALAEISRTFILRAE